MEFGEWFPKGSKVVYLGENGLDYHRELADKYLEVGKSYTVSGSQTFGWHSEVELAEAPGVLFNTVMFELVNRDHEVAKVAYYKWQDDGGPDGKDEVYWSEAEKAYYGF
jgi:hypothetical protein